VELRDYLDVARKRWRVIVAVTLAVVAAAALWTATTTRTYASTTQFFVSTSGGDNAASLQQGNSFTQARVKSYTQLLESPKILDPVIAATGLDTTAAALAGHISATVPLDTVVIEVTVTDTSATRAADIARAIAGTFPKAIADIEQVQSDQQSPVKVTVVKQAAVDPTPVSPRPARNLALGLALGLLLGAAVAVLRDVLDQRVKSSRDLESVTDATVIGGIAYDADAGDHPLIVQVDPRSPRAEAFRSVRTNLQFIDVTDAPRTIVVTSSVAGEGKSTTVANLGLTLAETGHSVAIIEGDLRRPRLLEYLGFEGAVGLTDVLIGRLEAHEAMQQFGRSDLWLLGAGPIPPNPSELLGSPSMAALIERLGQRFDHVLIDAPPLLPVTDAAVLSTLVDGAVVVVGAGVVTRDQLRHALDSLEAVNGRVLGVILNRLQAGEGGAYGTYAYDYSADTERTTARGPGRLPAWLTRGSRGSARPGRYGRGRTGTDTAEPVTGGADAVAPGRATARTGAPAGRAGIRPTPPRTDDPRAGDADAAAPRPEVARR
jgi:capsular exopolysaccharide synthesis family protein